MKKTINTRKNSALDFKTFLDQILNNKGKIQTYIFRKFGAYGPKNDYFSGKKYLIHFNEFKLSRRQIVEVLSKEICKIFVKFKIYLSNRNEGTIFV